QELERVCAGADPGEMAASSFRYGMTITGAVLLVTGTLCFAWWSDGEVGSGSSSARLLPPREAEAVPSSSSSSSALLRSVSFFCCGIGGILLIFGLLWSVKANARVVSRRYQYHFPRDLQYFTAEPPEKWNCRWEPRPCAVWVGGGGIWLSLSLSLLPALLAANHRSISASSALTSRSVLPPVPQADVSAH
uniref:Transmembrane protein 61 n=1 Tax=Malurus cyaneus samueli TaxID=2593467 RepID=A0A8C5X8I9_9PASS